ncbi:MAG: PEGA domain-containing protein [Planctomycetes bacterium]|nr:PEGA domain-containing protein [Planctomycetota bacterium]
MSTRAWVMLMLAITLPALTGCGTTRTITVTSEPSNALVYLNDEEVGRTPVTVPFTFYGVYDLRLEAEGCKPLWTKHEAKAPLWEYPGPDLFGEALGGKSELKWHFHLDPLPVAEEPALVDRARQMRAMMKQEVPETQPVATQPEPETDAGPGTQPTDK